MREIKFRAKRIDDGRWVYGQYFVAPLTDENSGTKPEDGWFFLSDGETRHCISSEYDVVFTIDVNTLSQYTNLKINGQEIYEGDFIEEWEDGKYLWLVKWNKSYGSFFLEEQQLLETFYLDDLLEVIQKPTSKVIGNIYENPELLEGNTP